MSRRKKEKDKEKESGKPDSLLFCPKYPIACIPKSWADIGVFVQAAIHMADINLDIWVGGF